MIQATSIASAVEEAILRVGRELRPDVLVALEAAADRETSARGREVLAQLVENARIATRDGVALCQDTGTAWIYIELGEDDCIAGDLQAEVDGAVARAYRAAALRMSVNLDALFDRTNSGDNTPAFIEMGRRPGTGATVHIMLKGAGSDNASRIEMIYPSAGWEGVKRVVADAIAAKAYVACPPLLVAVGVGSTFDKVGTLAKKALAREIGSPAQSEEHAAREAELLEMINATGIGPAGLGGDVTALAVHLTTAPSHIASLPVAVNIGCNSIRSTTVEVAS